MLSSPYFQHALYSIACLSLSINLLGMRRSAEDDKSRMEARISILESIKEQLTNAGDVDSKELGKLMRLANKLATRETDRVLGDDVSWSDIFTGKAPKVGKESQWEKDDLEKCE